MKLLKIIKMNYCKKMFKPWGESKEESWWKCGDEHNGKPLICPECYKKVQRKKNDRI